MDILDAIGGTSLVRLSKVVPPGCADVLAKLEFLVVQDIFLTETAKLADVVLPASSVAEKSGRFTNLERRLQELNRAEESHGESRPDWDILHTLAKKMGSAMHYASPADIMKEANSVAVIIPGRTTDKEYAQIKELLPLLKGVTTYPIVRRSNLQGALDMGVMPDYYPGYQKVDDPAAKQKFEAAWGVSLSGKVGLTLGALLEKAHHHEIKAMYIMGENVMLSDPDLKHVEDSLNALDFLVVQDIFLTETARLANVVLPAASFAEKDGTFTNTERRVQRIRT